jgi:serine/threonine-protein kinase
MREPSTGTRAAQPPGVDVGATLGSHELVELLGAGAMGRVYRARHVRLGREVAVKVLNAEYVARPDIVQRFFREARVVNDIDHEHIVEVWDFVEQPGLAYLVMELLEGESLRALMKRKGRKYLPLRRMLAIMTQVCDALGAAHEKGVVHRDLKPDNVFVAERHGADFVKVLDFGVAKLHDSLDKHETSAGVILGTPHYMAPEQALGRDVDGRADVWAAGVVLYEFLAGAVPFTAPSFVELATLIREGAPRPLPRKTPRGERIPAPVAAAVMRCLEKAPSDRFRSMGALADALRGPDARARGSRRLRRLAPIGAALAAAALAGAWLRLPGRVSDAVEPAGRAARELIDDARAAVAAEPRREGSGAAEAERRPAATARPAPPPAPAGPARKPATPTASKPHAGTAAPARRTVELDLRSSPAGATVVRLDTGARLGKTPLRVNVARKEARVWLQMRLDGHGPLKFQVDLRSDTSANVTLKRAARKTARR